MMRESGVRLGRVERDLARLLAGLDKAGKDARAVAEAARAVYAVSTKPKDGIETGCCRNVPKTLYVRMRRIGTFYSVIRALTYAENGHPDANYGPGWYAWLGGSEWQQVALRCHDSSKTWYLSEDRILTGDFWAVKWSPGEYTCPAICPEKTNYFSYTVGPTNPP